MYRTALISWDEGYRFTLTRIWNRDLPLACIIMLNPSTADSTKDDATIRALIRLLTSLGYGGFEVVNLFAWRATNPAELATTWYPVGGLNNQYITNAINQCAVTVCAWGAHKYVLQSKRGIEVLKLIDSLCEESLCFGMTKAGAPKHPLYLKTGNKLEFYYA